MDKVDLFGVSPGHLQQVEALGHSFREPSDANLQDHHLGSALLAMEWAIREKKIAPADLAEILLSLIQGFSQVVTVEGSILIVPKSNRDGLE